MTQSPTSPVQGKPSPCGRPLLYTAETLSVYHAEEKPKQGEAHSHDDIQIALPISGPFHAAWQTDVGRRREQVVAPGALSLSASRQPHLIQVERETELAVVWLPAAFLIRTAEDLAVSSHIEITHTGEVQDALLQQLCLALLTEIRQNQNPERLYMDAMANLLAAHLVRQHSAQGGKGVEMAGGLSTRRRRLVLAYIQDHLEQDISLADLAGIAGLSPSHFGPLFRQSFGKTPYQYVLNQRLERAKQLLCAGGLSVGEVAVQVGFCDQSQFTRQFKLHMGLTPRAFVKAIS